MNESIRKTQIREIIRSRRVMIDEETAKKADDILLEQFLSVPDKDFQKIISSAKCVALYSAIRGELPCNGIAKFFMDNLRTVCYPRVKGDTMDFYEVFDEKKDFTIGSYGLAEPKSTCRKIHPDEIDLMIVPALAYSEGGQRLGQGGGYYDRYLNAAEKLGHVPFTCGVCYDFQVYSSLPLEPHDRIVDVILAVEIE